jgi:hypothetical protein
MGGEGGKSGWWVVKRDQESAVRDQAEVKWLVGSGWWFVKSQEKHKARISQSAAHTDP